MWAGLGRIHSFLLHLMSSRSSIKAGDCSHQKAPSLCGSGPRGLKRLGAGAAGALLCPSPALCTSFQVLFIRVASGKTDFLTWKFRAPKVCLKLYCLSWSNLGNLAVSHCSCLRPAQIQRKVVCTPHPQTHASWCPIVRGSGKVYIVWLSLENAV